ncbi:MAG: hypothetical protein CVU19_01705 [Betaproteobacteria bacterium HGW-Betaproteobacteria-13]|jgi:hypothetical protein|nr:MAG: hypothetical protein CVU28_00050 [Betaproteobacteria bacterium HGW-Betaproteobacteria-21]PKO82459.1 MAG: hypothetical protein CVU19_01705 [Betaproteobacteria bacterium HGW-Betaproteobacteria-13]
MAHTETIIVAGCMRSGTTALQSLVCSTDATNPLIPECDFLIELTMLFKRNKEDFEQRRLRPYFGSEKQLQQYIGNMIEQFLDITRENFHPATKLALKNPELTPFLPLLHRLLPKARFVVSIRDPRDTIASIVDVADRLAARGQNLYVVGNGRDIQAAANYFNAIYAPILQANDTPGSFRDALIMVRYEDLCSPRQSVVDAVAAHCGLNLAQYDPDREWRRAMEIDRTAWGTPLWGKGVSGDSVGRYDRVLTPEEIAVIEITCAPFMRRFGYTTASR